jgi:HEAT repeat protein
VANPSREHLEKTLSALFDAERAARKLHDELADAKTDDVLDVLTDAVGTAMKEPREEEAALRLVRIANVLGTLEGPRVVDTLIDVLGSEWPEARDAAGQELEGLAYDRFKEVAQGVERALKRLPSGSPALQELPYILSEIPEPGVSKLLVEFLQHEDAEAVAAALTVAVEMGDGSLAKHVKKLLGDKRVAEIADESDEEELQTVTLGELAEEALEVLAVMDSEGAQGDA